MKAMKFTYDLAEIKKVLAKHYGLRLLGGVVHVRDDNTMVVKANGSTEILSGGSVAEVFGGVRAKFVGKGKKLRLHVWKKILTYSEFWEVMRRHNVGFADKGKPKVLKGVIVYSPSASGWKRKLWNCPVKSRSYRTTSDQEVFLEKDPSAGLIRHPYCHMKCLDGSESLMRQEFGWKADYCYIEG